MKKAFVVSGLLVLAVLIGSVCDADAAAKQKRVVIKNQQSSSVTASISFAADSEVNAQTLGTFCKSSTGKLNCVFDVPANGSKEIPNPGYKYLNMALAFKANVGCGSTKAEVTVNNPKWYDVLDVSLVDGFNEKIQINVTPAGGKATVLGPPKGKSGNQKVFGVFPEGCDVCVERRNPPCGYSKGKSPECKAGTEMKPDVVCQYQDNSNNGMIEVILVP
ncbi:MAG TPA: hypothetical protein PLR60_06125 [Syntrophorhabdaceae bacterium]|nr:hypothetical protein [Syntrophorhabdaceae bacterium]